MLSVPRPATRVGGVAACIVDLINRKYRRRTCTEPERYRMLLVEAAAPHSTLSRRCAAHRSTLRPNPDFIEESGRYTSASGVVAPVVIHPRSRASVSMRAIRSDVTGWVASTFGGSPAETLMPSGISGFSNCANRAGPVRPTRAPRSTARAPFRMQATRSHRSCRTVQAPQTSGT